MYPFRLQGGGSHIYQSQRIGDKYLEEFMMQVEKEEEDIRIDRYLSEKLANQSRSYLQKLLKENNITVNGLPIKSSYKVQAGDQVCLIMPELKEPDILPEEIPLDILYEDNDVLVINKPKNMVVHPSAGHYTNTIVNAVMFHCKDNLSGINGVLRPGIVHRIDMDTTGAIVICKNDMAHQNLAEQLKEHTITRKYHAIVCGNIREDEGTVSAAIGRHPVDRKKMAVNERNGKSAVTHYRVLERFGNNTYIECQLETGRTHQIRVHMASKGHPLLGDSLYGPSKCPFNLQGQCLHAMILGFIHPSTGEYIEFEAPLPEYFTHLLQNLRK
jgi:23S rRNA pseudouridine1911/1915/1917 synthase